MGPQRLAGGRELMALCFHGVKVDVWAMDLGMGDEGMSDGMKGESDDVFVGHVGACARRPALSDWPARRALPLLFRMRLLAGRS